MPVGIRPVIQPTMMSVGVRPTIKLFIMLSECRPQPVVRWNLGGQFLTDGSWTLFSDKAVSYIGRHRRMMNAFPTPVEDYLKIEHLLDPGK